MPVMTTQALTKTLVVVALAIGTPILGGGCSSQAPASVEPEATASPELSRSCLDTCNCGAGWTPQYLCLTFAEQRLGMGCADVCDDYSTPPPPTGAQACVYPPPPVCTTPPPPPSNAPACSPANQQTCGSNQIGGQFTPCTNGSCGNVANFESVLAGFGCQPGGNPATNTRTIVCYDPTTWPPGVINSDTGHFMCGYGEDWLYAVCPLNNPTTGVYQYQALQSLVSSFQHTGACTPVAPSSLGCPDSSGDIVSLVVYYDPRCGAGCGK